MLGTALSNNLRAWIRQSSSSMSFQPHDWTSNGLNWSEMPIMSVEYPSYLLWKRDYLISRNMELALRD